MAQDRRLVAFVNLRINGQDAPADIVNDLIEVTVDEALHLPTMFALRLHNQGMRWLDSDILREGAEVDVEAVPRPKAEPKLVCRGRIAAIEPDLNEQMPLATFRGYDLALGLFRGRRSRSFLNMTDADIVRRVAQDAGLEADVEGTPGVHEYVFQTNQSDMEFLRDRARRIGYEVFVDGKKLRFRRPASEKPIELEWARNLKSFSPRLSTAEPINEVVVRSWDPGQKKEIVGRVTRGNGAPRIGEQRAPGDVAQQTWGRQAKLIIVDHPVATQQEADNLARAMMDENVGAFVEAEGTCDGTGDLRAGKTVNVKGLGKRFEGDYYVTAATHVFRRDHGHTTMFTISGKRPSASQRALSGGRAEPRARLLGVAVGIVTNNKDDKGLGRVKVKFPWLADDEESHWARIAAPMAGAGRGFYYLPEIDDEVLVTFEHGDIHRPYVVGMLWNGKDKPPKANKDVVGSDGKVKQRILRSRTGHVITLDDSLDTPSISIVDQTGKNKIVIDSKRSMITIEAQGPIKIKGRPDVTVDAPANIKLGEAATLKLVNETFVPLFNGHTHIAGPYTTAPPVPLAAIGVQTTTITKGA